MNIPKILFYGYKISEEDSDYLKMFINLSCIEKMFEIKELDEDGTIKILKINSHKDGYIYKNPYNMYFYNYENNSFLFSGSGVTFPKIDL